jgi:arylsulfatase
MTKYGLLLAALLLTRTLHADDRPNIVLFIADDISQEDIGCYGHPVIKTPNIDSLASDGLRFDNAYLTISSCSPSRCSIVTGRYPHNTGAPELHSVLPDDQLVFPRLLKENGYYTMLSGKNHMKDMKEEFDVVTGGKDYSGGGHWVPLLKERPKDKPFFCWFASHDAHKGFSIDTNAPTYKPEEIIIPPYMVDGPKIREEMTGYYHEVSRYDTYIGMVVDEMKAQGVFDNTLIIIIADNGRPFPRAKTRVYDSGIKTPFVVHYPPVVKQAGVTDSLVSVIDISATCLQVAGVDIPDAIQGVSFLPILKNPETIIREVVFSEHNWHVNQAHERMVRFGEYLYIKNSFPDRRLWCVEATYPEMAAAHAAGTLTEAQANVYRDPCPAEELFHVSKDKDQLTNLAQNPEYDKVLQQMRTVLAAWTEETGDNVPENPTPDRGKGTGRNPHAEFPGAATGAFKSTNKGPIKLKDAL